MIRAPSPNFGPRREGAQPDIVVIHYTAMASAEAALGWLCAPEAEVSAHYLIAEDGRLWQMVDEDQRAWHAGAGAWGSVCDVNSRSIGIELANTGQSPFAAPLMARLEDLLAEILQRHAIPPERVIAHSDMAPGRKCDPGRRFDWRRLARQGLAVWPEAGAASTADPDGFQGALTRIGYPEVGFDIRLDAFRQRFRPWAHGPLDRFDMAAAQDLARRFPVDRPAPSA